MGGKRAKVCPANVRKSPEPAFVPSSSFKTVNEVDTNNHEASDAPNATEPSALPADSDPLDAKFERMWIDAEATPRSHVPFTFGANWLPARQQQNSDRLSSAAALAATFAAAA